jgi:hypothetical protein
MRGGNEIASCIYKEILRLTPEVKKVTFYSDMCIGQNRNNFMICMFLTLIHNESSLLEIHRKFLISGRTHMKCDVHSQIEKQKRKCEQLIAVPHD